MSLNFIWLIGLRCVLRLLQVVGALALPLVHMESVCGKILEGGGTLYLGLFCMKLEMNQNQKCSFG